MSPREQQSAYPGRLIFVLTVLGVAVGGLLWRVVALHVFDRDFLQQQGDARYLRVVGISAHRGMITDRNGEPLAISTPVDSVWANPKELATQRSNWPQLARLLRIPLSHLERTVAARADREFVYLRRHINPQLAERVMALNIAGVSLQREYRRYYPTGEVFGHVVGFTDIDDNGQDGIERLYDDWLHGTPGKKRVIKDRLGRIIQNVEIVAQPRPGRDLRLSLDRRIQYLAYRELKSAVQRHRARAGSAVVLDVATGEVVAMVNQPAYNPNNRLDRKSSRYRNRAVTDVFEPGSTVKPFTISAALESGKWQPDTPVDTRPGVFHIGRYTVRDDHNCGLIDVSRVIQKSSNVGASKIALSLDPDLLWGTFSKVGFGSQTGSAFPGEATGILAYQRNWGEFERATFSFGYGLSVTPLQLARAYTVLAGDGRLRPISFVPLEGGQPESQPAIDPQVVLAVRKMMEAVVGPGGTAPGAAIPGYRVAGKTGTVHKAINGGYSKDHYVSLFAGMAPASKPRLVMVVVIDEPSDGKYYGGLAAAPVFAKVMAGALRLLDVPPDDLPSLGGQLAAHSGAPATGGST